MQEDYYDKKTLRRLQKLELEIFEDFIKICEENNLEYFVSGGSALGAVRHKGFIPWDDDIDVAMSRRDYDKFLEILNRDYSDKYYAMNNDNNPKFPLMNTRMGLIGTEYKTEDLKDIPGEFGIFLDVFFFDNVADDDKLMRRQHSKAWFYGKLLVLSGVKRPVLYCYGIKKKILEFIFLIAHYVIKISPFSTRYFYKKAYKYATMYNDVETKRFAYMFDPQKYTSVVDKENVYPLRKIKFDRLSVYTYKNVEEYLRVRYGDYMKLPPEDKRHTHPPYSLVFDKEEKDKEKV